MTCQDGHIKFLGLPKKFLTEKDKEVDKCNYCLEDQTRCALARTRAQARREREEDEREVEEEQEITTEEVEEKEDISVARRKMIRWLEGTKEKFYIDANSPNLIDSRQECRLDTILTEEKYLTWCQSFFGLQKMFRACCMLASLEMTRLGLDYSIMEIKKEGQGILLRSGQRYYNKDIKNWQILKYQEFRR